MERRNRPRVDLAITATLMCRDEPVGRYTVQNLSAAGALLTGQQAVDEDAPLRVLLDLPSPLATDAVVKRQVQADALVALAVQFQHDSDEAEDQIQDAVLAMLDERFRAEHPAVLVVDRDEDVRKTLSSTLESRGRRAIACEAPLNAMQVLNDPRERVHAVVMRDGPDAYPELLQWVAETQSNVRPILLVEDRRSDPAVAHAGVRRCFPEHLDEHLS